MTSYLLCHRHTAPECRVVFAAWAGFVSPLRRRPAWASCLNGGHRLWWMVEAADEASALGHLPPYVAQRTEVVAVRPVTIP